MTRIVGLARDALSCSSCKKTLSLEHFGIRNYKNRRKKSHYNSYCKECAKIKAKAYRDANKEHVNSQIRNRRSNNPSKHREANRRWKERNPEASLTCKRRYKAGRKGAKGSYLNEEWLDLLYLYNYRCPCCLIMYDNLSVDHIVPLTLGGSNSIENIQPLCYSCNSSKGNRHSTRYPLP